MKRIYLLLTACLAAFASAVAGNILTVNEKGGSFALCANGRTATIVVSKNEPIAVKRVASLFADDVQRVSGIRPQLSTSARKSAVVIATLGHNAHVDQLVKKGRLDVSAIKGGWEQFVIRMLDGQLFIIGSDRRATAFGLMKLPTSITGNPASAIRLIRSALSSVETRVFSFCSPSRTPTSQTRIFLTRSSDIMLFLSVPKCK